MHLVLKNILASALPEFFEDSLLQLESKLMLHWLLILVHLIIYFWLFYPEGCLVAFLTLEDIFTADTPTKEVTNLQRSYLTLI